MDKYIQQSSSLFGSLKNAVLGNPVTREFIIGEQIASFGPGLLWKVFDGKKKSTGQGVSVFIFEKSSVDRYDKRHRELIFERMRHGPQQLTKLRHPRILTVQHPLEESRDCLAFATEPVFASLSNILGKHHNFSNGLPSRLKLAEGLSFLHCDANLNEGNLTADNVILTAGGQWKLAGFHFSSSKMNPDRFTEYSTKIPTCARQDLNYLAPEWIFAQSSGYTFDLCKSDMFSFGCLVNAVYNHLKTPFDAGDSVPAYKKSTEQLSRLGSDYLKNVPLSVREHVQLLLNVSADARPDAAATISHPFFDDVAAMTLKYLDSLVQRDDLTKSQFFKNLHHVLNKLPLRVLQQRVLPPLFSEFPNHMMIPFVLPNVLMIAEQSSQGDYMKLIFPELKKIFHVVKPVEVLLVFMQKMELLLRQTTKDEVKSYVFPLIFRALEAPSPQLQVSLEESVTQFLLDYVKELVIGVIPNFVHMIDYSSLKSAIIPRMKVLLTKSRSLLVRVNTLVCIGKIIEHLDKFLLIDDIFPAMRQIPSNEPAVLMAILGIYKQTMKSKKNQLEKDYLATQAIPFLLPLAMEPTLNAKQFNNYMSVIRAMFDRVEQEHRTKLEQLQKMQEEQRSSIDFVKAANKGSSESGADIMKKVDDLVIGKPSSAAASKPPDSSSEFNKLFGFDDGGMSQASTKPSLMEHTVSTTKSVANSSSTSYLDPIKPTSQISPPTNDKASVLSSQMMMNNVTNVGANQNYARALPQNQPKQPIYSKEKFNASFNTILSPEIRNFQSNQQPTSLATLQQRQQQQQQAAQQSSYNQPQSMLGTQTPMMQSQSQSITMFQTQTQMFMPPNNMNHNTVPNNFMHNTAPISNPVMPMNSSMLQPSNANAPLVPTKSANLSSQDINDLLL